MIKNGRNFNKNLPDPINQFYSINSGLKDKYKITKVKFALSITQRNELLEMDQKWQDPIRPKNFGKKQKIVLSKEQRKEFLTKIYSTNYLHGLIIELDMNTGLRVNEIANLIIE